MYEGLIPEKMYEEIRGFSLKTSRYYVTKSVFLKGVTKITLKHENWEDSGEWWKKVNLWKSLVKSMWLGSEVKIRNYL